MGDGMLWYFKVCIHWCVPELVADDDWLIEYVVKLYQRLCRERLLATAAAAAAAAVTAVRCLELL